MILAGDVGATKVLLEMGRMEGNRWRPAFGRRYAAADFADFEGVLRSFLSECPAREKHPPKIRRACFGVAGPASGNRVQMTNLAWALDGDAIARRFGIGHVRVVNDFAAAAAGIELLDAADLVTLQSGEAVPDAPCLVIGAGTGLGVAYLISVAGRRRVITGEAGHAGFAPANLDQWELWRFLFARRRRVTAEDVVSGPGLVRICEFLHESAGQALPPALAEQAGGDRAAAIVHAALESGDPVCSRTLNLFVTCYGSVTGDHALGIMALGGVYIAGGIAPRILLRLTDGTFSGAFNDKGHHSELAKKFPVSVVTNPKLGLMGAALLASARSSPVARRGSQA